MPRCEFKINDVKRKYMFTNYLSYFDDSYVQGYSCSGVIDRRMMMAWMDDHLSPTAMLFLSLGITFPGKTKKSDWKTYELTDTYWFKFLGTYIENVLYELNKKVIVPMMKQLIHILYL